MLWSTVTRVQSGRRTGREAFRLHGEEDKSLDQSMAMSTRDGPN